jgi:hypothetical protein
MRMASRNINGTMCPDRTFGFMALAKLKENYL